jgi:hypothetical protein
VRADVVTAAMLSHGICAETATRALVELGAELPKAEAVNEFVGKQAHGMATPLDRISLAFATETPPTRETGMPGGERSWVSATGRQVVTARVSEETVLLLDVAANRLGVTRSAMLTELLDRWAHNVSQALQDEKRRREGVIR